MSDEIADHVEDAIEIMRSLSARMAELEERIFDAGREHDAKTCKLGAECPWCEIARLEAENARLLSIMPPTAGAADPRFVGQGDWAVFADKVVAERDQLREDVRQAVADYMCSEGCSCCQDVGAHKRHAERLAQLLEVPKYEDRSGYNFYQYRSLSEEESS